MWVHSEYYYYYYYASNFFCATHGGEVFVLKISDWFSLGTYIYIYMKSYRAMEQWRRDGKPVLPASTRRFAAVLKLLAQKSKCEVVAFSYDTHFIFLVFNNNRWALARFRTTRSNCYERNKNLRVGASVSVLRNSGVTRINPFRWRGCRYKVIREKESYSYVCLCEYVYKKIMLMYNL